MILPTGFREADYDILCSVSTNGEVAQLVEHHVRNVGVESSNLFFSTILRRKATDGTPIRWKTQKRLSSNEIMGAPRFLVGNVAESGMGWNASRFRDAQNETERRCGSRRSLRSLHHNRLSVRLRSAIADCVQKSERIPSQTLKHYLIVLK